jgi:hypothetical protein
MVRRALLRGDRVSKRQHRLEADGWILRERSENHVDDRARNIVERRRVIGRDLPEQLVHRRRRVRWPAGEDLVREDADREHLATLVRELTGDLFGCHVQRRSEQLSVLCLVALDLGVGRTRLGRGRRTRLGKRDIVRRARHRLVQRDLRVRDRGAHATQRGRDIVLELREAEIEHLDPLGRDHDVRGLDVTVEDPAGVRRDECIADTDDPAQRGLQLRGAIFAQRLGERASLDELHHEDVVAIVGDYVEQRDHVGVSNRGGGLGFTQLACAALQITGVFWWQHLECNVAIEALVARAPHLTHGPLAERRDEPIRPDEIARRMHRESVASYATRRDYFATSSRKLHEIFATTSRTKTRRALHSHSRGPATSRSDSCR